MIAAIAERSKQQNFPRSRLPEFTPEEIERLKGSADFFGLNHYTSRIISARPRQVGIELPSQRDDLNVNVEADPSWEKSDADWLISNPEGFRRTLTAIKDRYNNPVIYVTENGFADKEMNDVRRIRYLDVSNTGPYLGQKLPVNSDLYNRFRFKGYLRSMATAIKNGCNVKAYITWSIMDNFEWANGYT